MTKFKFLGELAYPFIIFQSILYTARCNRELPRVLFQRDQADLPLSSVHGTRTRSDMKHGRRSAYRERVTSAAIFVLHEHDSL